MVDNKIKEVSMVEFDIVELVLKLLEVNGVKEELQQIITFMEKEIEKRGYSIRKTKQGKKLYVVFVGNNNLLCPDGKIRMERPKIRRSIEILMKKERLSIHDTVKYIKRNRKLFSKGYLTQARKMEYESILKKEMVVDSSKYKENVEIV